MGSILKIFQQTFWQVIVKALTTTFTFITLSAVARQYGEASTGVFTLALTYILFFNVFSDFNLNAHILGKLQQEGSSVWRRLFGTRIIFSLFLTAVALLTLLPLPYRPPSLGFSPEFKMTVLVGILGIILYAIRVTAHAYYQARLIYQRDLIPTAAAAVAGSLAVAILAQMRAPIYMVMLEYVLAWFIHAVGSLLLVLKFTKVAPIFDFRFAWNLIKQVWPLAATLVLNTVYFRIDAFLLSYFRPSLEVGIYNVAYQVFQALLVMPTFVMNSFYPMMLTSLNISFKLFKDQIRVAVYGLLAVSILTSASVYFLSPLIIKIITGAGFGQSVVTLQVLSVGLPAYFLSALFLWALIARRMYKPVLLIYLVGLVVNFSANLFFIPQYSYLAAAWISVGSEYLILLLQALILVPLLHTGK